MKRSSLRTKIIILALIIYAGASLVALRGRIEVAQANLAEVRRIVAQKEITNAELEYEIQHYNDPEVIARIARTRLGLVLPGEIVFYDGVSGQSIKVD